MMEYNVGMDKRWKVHWLFFVVLFIMALLGAIALI